MNDDYSEHVDIDIDCPNRPQLRGIYTVRAVNPNDSGVGVLLEEIVNEPFEYADGLQEADFYSWRFRPLVERKTDISIFTKTPVPEKVTA